MTKQTDQPALMNALEVAAYLRTSKKTIYRLLELKQIPAFKAGREWRFDRDQIDAWRLEQTAAPLVYSPRRVRR